MTLHNCRVMKVALVQGVDTVSEGIEQAQDLLEEAQKPGPAAPYSKQRLTVLDSPGPKAGEEDQV